MAVMPTTREQLQHWLDEPEGIHFEFKEAKRNFHFERLLEYCVALANEGGGKIVLGVTDRRPRRIVGTDAFAEPGRAEAGLHERAGQGFDSIVRECIRQSKPLPDLSRTDDHFVWLTLHGEIQDPELLRFLEEVGGERTALFGTDDFLVVDLVHREQLVPEYLRSRVDALVEQGVIERVGRGRGARLLLSQRFHRHLGKAGMYTRKRGLDRETNKALLEKHLQETKDIGAALGELRQVLPAESEGAIQRLLTEMRSEGRVTLRGSRRWARRRIALPKAQDRGRQ